MPSPVCCRSTLSVEETTDKPVFVPALLDEAVQFVLAVQLVMQCAVCITHRAQRPAPRRRSWLCLLFLASGCAAAVAAVFPLVAPLSASAGATPTSASGTVGPLDGGPAIISPPPVDRLNFEGNTRGRDGDGPVGACMHIHAHERARARTDTRARARAHAGPPCARARARARTHVHVQASVHTRTHVHVHARHNDGYAA